MQTVIGLGNPGKQYQHNRHNFGHLLVDWIVERFDLTLRPGKNRSAFTYAGTKIADQAVCFCKNTTYMNNSGLAVRQILSKLNQEVGNILVVYDDIDLPLGRIRLRLQGSAGGHRGLQSIIEMLATNQFMRLRLGIGPQDEGVPSEDFVLTDFRSAEKELVQAVLEESRRCIMTIIEKGLRPAMEYYNRRDLRAARDGSEMRSAKIQKPIILT